MMKAWTALALLALSSPALAGSYKIVLDRPASGRLLTGHMGLQAADDRTAGTLVRVVAPGNTLDVRGTVRVLVMNLSDKPFAFGPDQVTLRLGDGTILQPTPVEAFETRKVVAEQTAGRSRAIDIGNRNSLSSLVGSSSSGPANPSAPVAIPTGPATSTTSQDFQSDSDLLPHAETLNAIYQLLIPMNVGPQQAWGGYYVFDVPKAVQRSRTDLPLLIVVRTGPEEHRFSAMLHWK